MTVKSEKEIIFSENDEFLKKSYDWLNKNIDNIDKVVLLEIKENIKRYSQDVVYSASNNVSEHTLSLRKLMFDLNDLFAKH